MMTLKDSFRDITSIKKKAQLEIYNNTNRKSKETFARLEQLCKKELLQMMTQNCFLIGKINMVGKILTDINVLFDYVKK